MAIAGINGVSNNYDNIASGKRINTAADDAAGLAIANKMQRESNGFDVGASNIQDGIGVANIKDGALASMQENLQRIRELSLKASNSLYGDSEKEMIQGEVDQILQEIERNATNTNFNGLKLLDGSMADMNIASNPDGTGMKIQMENVTLKELGLDGYSVTGSIDISKIDDAMAKVNTARSNTGATTNAMEHAYNNNNVMSLELTGARSRIEDLDMPKAISEQKKNQLLQDYQMGMMKKKMANDSGILRIFGAN